MCIHDGLLKLDTVLPHSPHSRWFLDSPFLSKARSTYGNISMVWYESTTQALSVLIIILLHVWGSLGSITLALLQQWIVQSCYISLVTQQWKQETFQCYMLHVLSNTTIEADMFQLLWSGDIKELEWTCE
jgi:hypothetical protein